MALFSLPVEIRLKIYTELLVQPEPIDMPETNRGSESWPDSWEAYSEGQRWAYFGDYRRWPGILLTCKQVHGEAVSLLYSRNQFRFLDVAYSAHSRFARFLQQIGANARFLRHVSLSFPVTLFTFKSRDAEVQTSELLEVVLRDVDLLCDACPAIETLELFLSHTRTSEELQDDEFFAEMVDHTHTRLAALPSMPAVRVMVELWEDDAEDADDDDVASVEGDQQHDNSPKDDGRQPYEASLQLLRCRGWAVNIIRIPLTDQANNLSEFDMDMEEEAFDEEYYRQQQEWAYSQGYADDGGPA